MEKLCADCGEEMEIKENRKDGSKFWGCTSYPDCTYSERIEDDDTDGLDERGEDIRNQRNR